MTGVAGPPVGRTRRNGVTMAASAAAVGLLFLYPTSTNSRPAHRRPGQALAPAGVVGAAVPRVVASAAPTTVVVNGPSVDTPYGPVQVQVRVRGTQILAATAIDYPQGTGRDQEINSYAIPALERETLAAQSAQVDTVSGATFTSEGYRQSLQAALDTAHRG